MTQSPAAARTRAGRLLLLVLPAVALGCGGGSGSSSSPAREGTRITGESPFPAGCSGAPLGGSVSLGAEVEPMLAVDPLDPDHLLAAWQQDRWSNGGANGLAAAVSRDGGKSWQRSALPFTNCAGGAARGGDYDRASDPFPTFAADGTALVIGLALDLGSGRRAILVTRSSDGGQSWGDPTPLFADTSVDFGLDKCALTGDPVARGHVYAVWDRLTGLTNRDPATSTGPAWFARSTDGGQHWEAAQVLYDPGRDAQTISNQVQVLPDGTVVDLFVRITNASAHQPVNEVVVVRSTDQGKSFGPPIVVAQTVGIGAVDPKTGAAIRSGDLVPSFAVDPRSGALYAVWSDSTPSNYQRDTVVFVSSTDGGLHWSQPKPVAGALGVQAFIPTVAVGQGGKVAVSYFDFRLDAPGDASRALLTPWLTVSGDGGLTWKEVQLGDPFDLRAAPDAGGYFIGDYMGLAEVGGQFRPLLVATNSAAASNRTDVFFGGSAAAPALERPPELSSAAPQRTAPPGPQSAAERLRALREQPPAGP